MGSTKQSFDQVLTHILVVSTMPPMTCVVAFYNITCSESRFNQQERHEKTLGVSLACIQLAG